MSHALHVWSLYTLLDLHLHLGRCCRMQSHVVGSTGSLQNGERRV